MKINIEQRIAPTLTLNESTQKDNTTNNSIINKSSINEPLYKIQLK